MRVSLRQIAEKTGYSMNTVSRVLRDKSDVKAETKLHIRQVALEMGYIPNKIAKSLRLGKTSTIGIISADSSNPFFSEVILGIEERARSLGYHILLVNTEEDATRELEAIKDLIARRVDGLLLMPVCGEQDKNNVEFLRKLPIPFVLVGRWLPGLEDHAVLTDEYEKAREITSLFLSNGHRNIIHLSGPSYVSSTHDRIRGFRDAMQASQIAISDQSVIGTKGHLEDGRLQINSLIREKVPFTAIFAFNDLVAIGALRALKENGLRVPKDVEVMGFDDLDSSQYLYLSLSTVRIPKQLLGRVAFEELYEHIQRDSAPYQRRIVESRIMLRETTLFE